MPDKPVAVEGRESPVTAADVVAALVEAIDGEEEQK